MKNFLLLLSFLLAAGAGIARPKPKPRLPAKTTVPDSAAMLQRAQRDYVDSVNGTLHYQQGHIKLPATWAN